MFLWLPFSFWLLLKFLVNPNLCNYWQKSRCNQIEKTKSMKMSKPVLMMSYCWLLMSRCVCVSCLCVCISVPVCSSVSVFGMLNLTFYLTFIWFVRSQRMCISENLRKLKKKNRNSFIFFSCEFFFLLDQASIINVIIFKPTFTKVFFNHKHFYSLILDSVVYYRHTNDVGHDLVWCCSQ